MKRNGAWNARGASMGRAAAGQVHDWWPTRRTVLPPVVFQGLTGAERAADLRAPVQVSDDSGRGCAGRSSFRQHGSGEGPQQVASEGRRVGHRTDPIRQICALTRMEARTPRTKVAGLDLVSTGVSTRKQAQSERQQRQQTGQGRGCNTRSQATRACISVAMVVRSTSLDERRRLTRTEKVLRDSIYRKICLQAGRRYGGEVVDVSM